MICRRLTGLALFFSLRTGFSPVFSNNLLVYNMYIFLYILGTIWQTLNTAELHFCKYSISACLQIFYIVAILFNIFK